MPSRHDLYSNYRNGNIHVCSDSQAAIRALSNHGITAKLVWDCLQSTMQLAKHNRVHLLWVPGHEDTDWNETACQLAKQGSELPFVGPEPACGISIAADKKAARDTAVKDDGKRCDSLSGLKHTNALIQGLSADKAKELLELNTNQL
jgi:hypothetical protein